MKRFSGRLFLNLFALLALVISALGLSPTSNVVAAAPNCTTVTGNVLTNCSFETGFTGWIPQDLSSVFIL